MMTKNVGLVTTPWIYHSSDLWLISLSSDWTTWLTISDKNLWATTVWNNGDTNTLANCWYFYQRWNCYGFDRTHIKKISKSTSAVSASWYWPWNYYTNSIFRYQMRERDTSDNKDLWGWQTNTNESKRWPCDEWYHIPTFNERGDLITIGTTIGTWTTSQPANFKQYLKLPWCKRLDGWNCSLVSTDEWVWSYWQSRYYYDDHTYALWIGTTSLSVYNNKYYNDALPIRPFKNEAVQPDTTWDVLYQSS